MDSTAPHREIPGHERAAGIAARLLRMTRVLVELGLVTALAGWIVGRFCSDRYYWSQFLLWIPTPAILLTAGLGLLMSWRRHRKRRRIVTRHRVWIAALFLLAVYFFVIEHRFVGRAPAPAPDDLKILVWTMSHAKNDVDAHRRMVLDGDADISFLTHAYGMDWPAILPDLLGEQGLFVRVGPHWVLTRVRVMEISPIVALNGIDLSLIRFDTTERFGRPLTVCVIDLPSDPTIGRAAQAEQIVAWLASSNAPPFDLVVGDCNTPRGSWSLDRMFPGTHNAFNDAGRGYGATFHRVFPLYHIDQMLLADDLAATSYRLIDPDVGRHRLQIATIAPSDR